MGKHRSSPPNATTLQVDRTWRLHTDTLARCKMEGAQGTSSLIKGSRSGARCKDSRSDEGFIRPLSLYILAVLYVVRTQCIYPMKSCLTPGSIEQDQTPSGGLQHDFNNFTVLNHIPWPCINESLTNKIKYLIPEFV